MTSRLIRSDVIVRMVEVIRAWRREHPHEKGDDYALAEQVYVACEAFAKAMDAERARVAADNKADEEWRERLARALWKVDREDMPENSVIHSISPLDEGWGYLEQADAVLSSIDAAGCAIAPKKEAGAMEVQSDEGWRDMALVPPDTMVLLFVSHSCVVGYYSQTIGRFVCGWTSEPIRGTPVRWMPLPARPSNGCAPE